MFATNYHHHHEQLAGNPFYAEELLAAWRRGEGPGLPGSLRETLLARVERVSEPARAVLVAAATAGRRVDHRLLAMASGVAAGELPDAVRETVAQHLLLVDPDGQSLAFRHALMREAVEAELLPGERGRLHAALAAAIAAHPRWAGGTDAMVAAELAYHWDAALELERALPAAIAAGVQAERVYAFANAARHFERAAELWDRVPEAAAVAPMDRAAVLEHAAEAVHRTDDQPRAVALLRAALGALDPAADPRRAGVLQQRLGRFMLLAGEPGALDAFQEAVRLLPAEPPSAERAQALAAYAQALDLVSRLGDARRVAEEALATARRVGARREEGRAAAVLGGALALLGDPDAGVALLQRARGIAEELDDIDGLGWAWICLVGACQAAGRLEEARALALESAEPAARLGVAGMYGDFLEGMAADLEFRLGHWEAAERRSRAVLARDRLTSVKGIHLRLWRARLEIARGDLPAARGLLGAVLAPAARAAAPQFAAAVAAGLAELAVWEDRHADAAAAVREGLAAGGDLEEQDLVVLVALDLRAAADRAAAALARRRPQEAAAVRREGDELLARLRAVGGPDDPLGRDPEPGLAPWRTLSEAEHARLHDRPDPAAWGRAAAGWERLGEPDPAAYTRWRQAEALLATGAPRAAVVAPLGQAAEVAGRLGAGPLLAEVTRLARRARVPLPQPGPQPPARTAAPFGLSGREREVLALLADGRSNREIGALLYVTEKTASFHVSSILAKLGVATRVEAAAVAHRLGLLDGAAGRPGSALEGA